MGYHGTLMSKCRVACHSSSAMIKLTRLGQKSIYYLIEKIISGFLRNVFRNVTNNTWTQSYGHEQEDLQEPQETQEKCQTKT